jgi:hypothetical protein
LNRANDNPETNAGGKYELAFKCNRSFRLVDRIGREAMDDSYWKRVSIQSRSEHAILPAKHTDRAGETGFIRKIFLVLPLLAALDRLRLPNILAIITERTCGRMNLEIPHRQFLRKTNQYFCSAKRQVRFCRAVSQNPT